MQVAVRLVTSDIVMTDGMCPALSASWQEARIEQTAQCTHVLLLAGPADVLRFAELASCDLVTKAVQPAMLSSACAASICDAIAASTPCLFM